jgi:hypothetical protein
MRWGKGTQFAWDEITMYKTSSILLLLAGLVAPAGCQRAVPSGEEDGKNGSQSQAQIMQQASELRKAAKSMHDMGELKVFALAYIEFAAANRRGPSGVDDLKSSLTPKMLEALKEDSVYVVIWKISKPTGQTLLAYAAVPDSYGKWLVVWGDGLITRLEKMEFEEAKRDPKAFREMQDEG